MDRLVTNDGMISSLDMLILTGDIFDHLLNNADPSVYLIHRWVTNTLRLCAKYDTMLRIVEGTPSHDRKQSMFFVEQARNADIKVDLHYATTLSIEYIERIDAHFLYIPDKWRNDTQTTLSEARAEMSNLGLTQVDFAIMHGAFEYQLPEIVEEPTHDSNTYLDLVKHYILIGHVHLPTRKEKILAAGSFDRLCHGEEGDKGCYLVTVDEKREDTVFFLVNKGAKIYKALHVHGMDSESVSNVVKEAAATHREGSSFMLRCHPNDPASEMLRYLQASYPRYIWGITRDEGKKKKETLADTFKELDLSGFDPITPENILTLAESEIAQRASNSESKKACLRLLEELVHV